MRIAKRKVVIVTLRSASAEGCFEPGEAATGWLRNPRLPHDAITVVAGDGARLHVRVYGPADAPPIVLAHGVGCRIEYWNPQINALAADHRVIAFDQRGFGRSTPGTTVFSVDTLADDLAAVLSATVPEGRPAILVGHSMGGISVMAWAQRHPAEVSRYAGAVLLSNTIAERFVAETLLLPGLTAPVALLRPIIHLLLRTGVDVPPQPLFRKLFQSTVLSARASPATVDYVHALVRACSSGARRDATVPLANLDVTKGISHLSCPVTVVGGHDDRMTPLTATHAIAARLRAGGNPARVVELPGVGHCANLEAVTVFNDEILRLVERVSHLR